MQAAAEEEPVKEEIEKTLMSINDIFLAIKHELKIVHEMVKESGDLDSAVQNANEKLTAVAEKMKIDIAHLENVTEEALQLPTDPIAYAEELLATLNI